LEEGVHVYLPPCLKTVLEGEAETEMLRVSSPSEAQARGKRMLLRDETFVSACASGRQALRWVLTPQYLSRRVFLHHDQTLLSKSGHPVSWFRTTMFDVTGLPKNQDGESVFKMSYNSRTEFNVCYDVVGTARVRMARHPYQKENQAWEDWLPLDSNSTYHLNEAAGSPEEECRIDSQSKARQYLRNKHEVYIQDGYVSLFCLFDPAPTGIERHRPGEYSDYEPLSQILGTNEYQNHKRDVAKYDEMVDRLSMAKATGNLAEIQKSTIWELYRDGQKAQAGIEAELKRTLSEAGNGRTRVLTRWMQQTGA
jgi:hypothetical protein